jgi:hypothetical protein
LLHRLWSRGITGAANEAPLQVPDPQPETNRAEAKASPDVLLLPGGGSYV